jgi:ATP-dependent helicase YprA (DUF1998 family)
MHEYNKERVRENAHRSDTEDLLDRVTVYRADMEPDALYVIEDELRQRGVTAAEIDAHVRRREEAGAVAERCSFCSRPAVIERWGWHKLWGQLPLFPRPLRYCEVHRPATSR